MVSLGGTFVVLLLLVTAFYRLGKVDPATLARRCAENTPAWNSYSEDIKAIGAGPIARWRGTPVRLDVLTHDYELWLTVAPPWPGWGAGPPILLKTPEGTVLRHGSHTYEGNRARYLFPRQGGANDNVPPWLEVRYPHGQQRLYLDDGGRWTAEAGARHE
jgi:hypothetical protein